MALKDALNSLKEAVEDLTSLHVQTFTGIVDCYDSSVGFSDLRTSIRTKADTEAEVTLVAESYIQFDGDSYNFVIKDGVDEVPKAAFEMHNDAVEAGLKTRQALLALFVDVVGL